MIDIRYHIYSLAAIFFALAVGIVIGTSYASRTPATGAAKKTIHRYEALTQDLKTEIEAATDESRLMQTKAKDSEDFCRAVLPIVVKRKLEWRNVAIVQTGDYSELSGFVKRTLEQAGARVNSISVINHKFSLDDYAQVSELLTSCGITPPSGPKEAGKKLIAIIAESLSSNYNPENLPVMEKAGVGKFTGDFERYNKLVVLVGGRKAKTDESADDFDSQLVAQLEKRGITVVGCEGTKCINSHIPVWSKTGIATVDNADTAMGQIALICALNGEKAQFGEKETAERLIPQTLETK